METKLFIFWFIFLAIAIYAGYAIGHSRGYDAGYHTCLGEQDDDPPKLPAAARR